MPIYFIAKIFRFFRILIGECFLNMPSEQNLAPQSGFKRACGKLCPLALESPLKALFWLFTKFGGRNQKIYRNVKFFDP